MGSREEFDLTEKPVSYTHLTKAALKSVRANSAMIKKVYVPKYLYPLSSVLFNYVIFLISLIVLVPVGAVLCV